MSAPIPSNEAERLRVLRELNILDTAPEAEYDDLVRLASYICGTPVALISLVDEHRQWFKARQGMEMEETPREVAFCAHAILDTELFVVPDATQDPRFRDSPLVRGERGIRFYAGAPLITQTGLAVGTLCAIDHRPRHLEPHQEEALLALSRQAAAQLELRRSYQQLRELERLRDSLTHMVVHDMRTPLTALLTGLQTLESTGEFDPLQQECLDLSMQGGEILLGMINDLLDIAKMEDGSLQLQRAPIAAAELLERALRQVQGLARERRHTVSTHVAPGVLLIDGDEEKLVRVLVNLLGNAVKFTPTGGAITVRMTPQGGELLCCVQDTGEGIPPEAFDRIFEKFGQAETRRAGRKASSGLGLTFCKMAVEAHGGRIWVESELNQGSTFWFTLPLHPA